MGRAYMTVKVVMEEDNFGLAIDMVKQGELAIRKAAGKGIQELAKANIIACGAVDTWGMYKGVRVNRQKDRIYVNCTTPGDRDYSWWVHEGTIRWQQPPRPFLANAVNTYMPILEEDLGHLLDLFDEGFLS
jgi:hypothetical protein